MVNCCVSFCTGACFKYPVASYTSYTNHHPAVLYVVAKVYDLEFSKEEIIIKARLHNNNYNILDVIYPDKLSLW